MLQYIRERSQGVVAWIIVIIIIIPFAIWGIDQFQAGDRIELAAKVDGEPMTKAEFMRAFDNVKRQYQENLGEMYSSLVQEDKLRQEVLSDLIDRRAVDLTVQDAGFAIPNALIDQTIQSQKVFQEKGVFSAARYEQVLKENNYDNERFKKAQREFMQRNQFESFVSAAELVGSSEVQQLAGLETQQREIGYLRVDHRPFLDKVVITDDQMQQYYQQNVTQFKAPEQVSVDYLRLSVESMMEAVQVSEEQVKAYYQEHPDKVQLPEKRNVRHILIMAAKDADVAVHNSAAQKAQMLLEQVKAGGDFAELAKQNSEDPGSAARGGELGFFQRGDMVPEFEQAAFALQKTGDLSSVVKTNYGYHVLQLIAVEAAQTPAFEKVRDIMAMELKSELAMKQYTQAIEQLKTISYEQADSLEPAAKALQLVVQQSPLMTRDSGEGVFASPNVVEAMFSASVVKEKMNSAVIEPQAGEAIVMHVNRHQPEYEKSFAEVKADIQRLVARKEAIAMAAAQAKTLLSEVKKPAADPVMQVKEGVEWKSPEWMTRNEAKVLPEVIAAAFKAPKPKADQATWVSHQLTTGDTVLIRLSGVRQDDAKIKQIEGELKQAAQQVFSDAMSDAVTNAIRQKADVEILLK